MAGVVLFHHAYGLTSGVAAFADDLRHGGHTVHMPDLYQGQVFDDLEEGLGYAREVGFGTLLERGTAAAVELPEALVYGGFSLGVLPAQQLAQTRPGAIGALLLHSCFPTSEFDASWPEGVPVQVHGMVDDPFFVEDLPAAEALIASTSSAELFRYPGSTHLFTDRSLPGYDGAAAALLTERVLELLQRFG